MKGIPLILTVILVIVIFALSIIPVALIYLLGGFESYKVLGVFVDQLVDEARNS